MNILLLPIGIQGLAMFFDEFYFHHKRGLPRWERIGHPIDTFSVLICYLYLLLNQPTDANLKIYIGLCLFSCLLITKDEFIHTEKCEAKENWLHAILFILHPITFLAAGVLWIQKSETILFTVQSVVIFSFMIYQIVYWSFHGKSK
jgi:phosphatidylserine synthase